MKNKIKKYRQSIDIPNRLSTLQIISCIRLNEMLSKYNTVGEVQAKKIIDEIRNRQNIS